jgi:sugar lactone lactonase YvrE
VTNRGTLPGASSVTKLTASGTCTGGNCNFAPSGANFDSPIGVAIDAAGNVWVTNCGNVCGGAGNGSVTKLTSSAACTGGNCNFAGNINSPNGVAIDADGNAWVTNGGSNSVTELTSSGGLAGYFAPSGANFASPNGVAIDAAGNFWVTNSGGTSVVELIGAARPVQTPLVACLKKGKNVCLP